jgi:hypothetical protein
MVESIGYLDSTFFPGDASMNTELLTCRRLTAGLLYQPVPFQTVDLNRLYALITEHYPYQALQHLPDGIRMANPDGDCFIQQGRIQINENVMYFDRSKEKCMDIFKIVTDKLGINQFLTFGVKLTAFLPMDEENAAVKFVDQHALSIRPEEWDLLGPGRKGTGLRVVLHQDGVYELKIEPFFGDLSQLYVELDIQHPEPFIGLDGIEARMDAAYAYMFNNIKSFLASLG